MVDTAAKEIKTIQTAQVVPMFVINMFCSLMTAMEHNALQFLVKFTVWDYHFMHYFFTFLCLAVVTLLGKVPRQLVPWRELLPVVVTRLFSSIGINLIADGNREGLLFMLRFCDVFLTLFVIFTSVGLFGFKQKFRRQRTSIITTLAVLSSLSWFYPYFWHNEYTRFLLVPLAAVAGGLHNLFAYNQFQKLNVPFDTYLLNLSGVSAVILLLPVLANKFLCFNCVSDSTNDGLEFEMVDYAIFFGAIVTMSGMIYTQYILMCHCHPLDYLALRHFKYSLAAAGQQVIMNLMHANFVNITSTFASIAMGLWYVKDMQTEERKSVLPT